MGRTKLIETPEMLWQIFKEYREYTKSRPRTATPPMARRAMAGSINPFCCFIIYLKGFQFQVEDYQYLLHFGIQEHHW